MRAQLYVEAGITESRQYNLALPETEFYIGRRRRGAKHLVILEDDHASRDHARIFWDPANECWLLEDCDSTNGTRHNDVRITAPVPLSHRDEIGAGGVCVRFLIEEDILPGPSTAQLPVFREESDPPSTHEFLDPEEITNLDKDEVKELFEFLDNAFHEKTFDGLLELALDAVMTIVHPDVAGFLALSKDFGTRMIKPSEAEVNVALSRNLTERMLRERQTIWLAKDEESEEEKEEIKSLEKYDDAICIPLGLASHTLDEDSATDPFGALHVYRSRAVFSERNFTFCEVLGICLTNNLRTLSKQLVLEAESARSDHGLISDNGKYQLLGKSKTTRDLIANIHKLARVPCSVLIRGETGSGKELVARGLHWHSTRRDRPFVPFNCANLTPSMADAILFGHAKGSFTGADADRRGLFRRAEGGTLFLDEIGELNEECQAKLLRVLEDRTILPVGGESEVSVDVRVIAATNRDLEEESESPLRRDLAYRLGMTLQVAPLRAHPEDIPLLAEHFMQHFNREYRRTIAGISVAAVDRLQAYTWPGNVRELRVVIERAVLTCESNVIQSDDLYLPEQKPRASWSEDEKVQATPPVAFDDEVLPAQLEQSLRLEDVERRAIYHALKYTGGNKSKASDVLGICRDTLLRKLKKYEEEDSSLR